MDVCTSIIFKSICIPVLFFGLYYIRHILTLAFLTYQILTYYDETQSNTFSFFFFLWKQWVFDHVLLYVCSSIRSWHWTQFKAFMNSKHQSVCFKMQTHTQPAINSCRLFTVQKYPECRTCVGNFLQAAAPVNSSSACYVQCIHISALLPVTVLFVFFHVADLCSSLRQLLTHNGVSLLLGH